MERFWGKIEKIALFLFLLAIPTQLGRHFWPEWSQVMGVRVDYLSPTLYLADILCMIWIVSKLRITNYLPALLRKTLQAGELRIKKLFSFENLIFLLLIAVNVIVAGNRWVAIYRWVRIIQWLVTIKLMTNDKLRITNYLKWIIPIWVIVESLLGLAQVINGGSLGGIWYWIGERRFSFSSLGIAQMSLWGEGMLRAYGSFSHPNSLAGFLLVCWWWWTRDKNKDIKYWVVYWAAILGIAVSGSRWVWGITTLLIINYELPASPAGGRITNGRHMKEILGKILIAAGLVSIVLGMVSTNYWLGDFMAGWDKNSLEKRKTLWVAAAQMIRESPLFGVGAGNFVAKLPEYQNNSGGWWLQPVHNILGLGWAEVGIVGMVVIGYRLVRELKLVGLLRKRENLILLGMIVATGMMDHYWLTLPQNSWLLAVILGII